MRKAEITPMSEVLQSTFLLSSKAVMSSKILEASTGFQKEGESSCRGDTLKSEGREVWLVVRSPDR